MFDLDVGGEVELWGGYVVDTIVEGTAHGGGLRRYWDVERFDRRDLDEQLSVGLSRPLLSSEFLDLFRVLILMIESEDVTLSEQHEN